MPRPERASRLQRRRSPWRRSSPCPALGTLDRAHITDATMVGHSYAGMVFAAAADRADGRLARLVHLDAYVPRDGDSCWPSTPSSRLVGAAIRLTDAITRVARCEFIYCSGWDGTPFTELHARLQADPEWQVHELPTAHNVMREDPDAVAALLLADGATDGSN